MVSLYHTVWVIFRPSTILCGGRFLYTKKSSSSYNIFRQKTEYDEEVLPMLDFIIHLLNIEKSRIQSFHVAVLDGITHFYISLYPRYPDCPFCGGSVHIHGSSRPKKINHPVLTARKSVIVYTATRYMCNDCHRTFTEANPLTYFDIAKRNHVSVSTVQRYMDSFLTIPRQPCQ